MKKRNLFAVPLLLAIAGLPGCQNTQGEQGTKEAEPGFLAKVFKKEPKQVTLPAGTVLSVRLQNDLSSHESQVGDGFSAVVVNEVTQDGDAVIPDGATVSGRVTEARPAKIGGRARLSLAFDSLQLPSGESVPIDASLAQAGKSQLAKDAAIIGGGTIAGAVLGEAVDEGEGGIIGAVVGGLGGAAGAKATKGKPVVVPAGTVISLSLTHPITVEVG